MAEERVRELLVQQNRPFNVQTITDHLAQFGVKKPQVQRAVDALTADGSDIICKEFGKTKIYFASQEGAATLTPEETEQKKALQDELTQQLTEHAESVKALKSELSALRNCMSLEEVHARTKQLQEEVEADEAKLMQLQSGTNLVTPEEREAVEKKFAANMDHWKKRKGIFKSIWGAVGENIDRKRGELFEEIGIEDQDDHDFRALLEFMPNKKRRV